jgi:hypothetical protein
MQIEAISGRTDECAATGEDVSDIALKLPGAMGAAMAAMGLPTSSEIPKTAESTPANTQKNSPLPS